MFIPRNILAQDGSAADATIAALFCTGVVNSQTSGLGGGFLLTYYDRATRTPYVLDSREVAARGSTVDMFQGNPKLSVTGEK